MDRNSIRSQRAEFRFWNYVGVRREETDPCLTPSIRLPHRICPVDPRTVSDISLAVDLSEVVVSQKQTSSRVCFEGTQSLGLLCGNSGIEPPRGSLFDHFVGAREQRRRDSEAERLCSL